MHVIQHDMEDLEATLDWHNFAMEFDIRCVILLPVHLQYLVRERLGKPLDI
jgi:hypothetical protein